MRQLSIIILHYNTPDFVNANLSSLNESELPHNTEVIVVNNGGHDANKNLQKLNFNNFKIKFFDIDNRGFPAGNNFGLAQTEAEHYAFINPDIEVQKNTFSLLLDYLKANKQVGIVSPQLKYPDGSIQDNYRVFPRILDLIIKRIPLLRKIFIKRMSRYLLWDRDPNANEPVDWVTGAFTIITNNCMQAIEKHDEKNFFLFMSDVALCREAYKKGFETHIVGSASCLHNDKRASDGGILQVFKSKTLQIHIIDAFRYFWYYKFEKLPSNAPSMKID
jgi:GT2 family glycosyltransferase